jgi:hypothetical protein
MLHETADSLLYLVPVTAQQVCPVLRDVAVLLAVLTNFMNGDSNVKVAAAEIGLSDLVHKLWVWCCALTSLLEAALKMLSTFTTACLAGKFSPHKMWGNASQMTCSLHYMNFTRHAV